MTFKELYKTIEKNKYYVFSFEDLRVFYPQEKRAALKKMVSRWKNKGWLYSLKRGIYELTYPQDFAIPDMHIANRLYAPSYVSLETALSNYSLIPEVSMAVTSITTKPTRKFKNKHGLFIYHTVKPSFFLGYYIEKHNGFNILMAEPEKALADFIYFKTYHCKKFNFKEERLNREAIFRLNQKKLNTYAKLYQINLKEFYAYL